MVRAPPKSLASSLWRAAPILRRPLMRSSIRCTPWRATRGEEASSPGSRKWFMPPTRATGSLMQAATQEPSSVVMARLGSPLT